MKIYKLSNCTGCSACYSACPKSAISMTETEEGFLYPKIDDDKCIKCGLCEKVCPAISPLKSQDKDLKAFAAI
ncbi:MAG: 4Fe-4S binding protein, partial [Bacteroidales bacterium]|nr:4Fe-4S binding protein [Bacteroidales bacterium]